MSKPLKIENTPRQVIENQLLAALDDKTKVAILCNEEDLVILIEALQILDDAGHTRHKELKDDLEQLKNSAFPKKAKR